MLGLLDAPHKRSCFDYAMAPIDVTDRDRREIQAAECFAVGERWLTAQEISTADEPVLMAANPGTGE
jgi:hypothetical protein